MFIIKKGSAGWEIIPQPSKTWSISRVESALRKLGYKISLSNAVLVVAKREHQINIFPSGKILVNGDLSKHELEKIANEIYNELK